jgi:hypothetical protein
VDVARNSPRPSAAKGEDFGAETLQRKIRQGEGRREVFPDGD